MDDAKRIAELERQNADLTSNWKASSSIVQDTLTALDAARRKNAELAAALHQRNLALQQVWNRLLSVESPTSEAWQECRSVIKDCRDGVDPAKDLAAHDAEVSAAARKLLLKQFRDAAYSSEDYWLSIVQHVREVLARYNPDGSEKNGR